MSWSNSIRNIQNVEKRTKIYMYNTCLGEKIFFFCLHIHQTHYGLVEKMRQRNFNNITRSSVLQKISWIKPKSLTRTHKVMHPIGVGHYQLKKKI